MVSSFSLKGATTNPLQRAMGEAALMDDDGDDSGGYPGYEYEE